MWFWTCRFKHFCEFSPLYLLPFWSSVCPLFGLWSLFIWVLSVLIWPWRLWPLQILSGHGVGCLGPVLEPAVSPGSLVSSGGRWASFLVWGHSCCHTVNCPGLFRGQLSEVHICLERKMPGEVIVGSSLGSGPLGFPVEPLHARSLKDTRDGTVTLPSTHSWASPRMAPTHSILQPANVSMVTGDGSPRPAMLHDLGSAMTHPLPFRPHLAACCSPCGFLAWVTQYLWMLPCSLECQEGPVVHSSLWILTHWESLCLVTFQGELWST